MKVIVNGLAVEYDDRGVGKVLLMLHGWKDSLHTFDEVAQSLSSSFRIVRVDLPGFGESEPPSAAWKLDNYVEFVKDFLFKVNVSPDILVGHSFGGRIIIKGVAKKLLTAKKIVLISSAGVARRRTFKNFALTVIAKLGRVATLIPPISFWRQRIRRKLYEAIGSDYFRSGAMSDTFLNIIREDLSEFARNTYIPTLIIWGENDVTTPITDGMRLSTFIRGSKFQVIKDAGHFVHSGRPKEVSELIRGFSL
jgi:pimeloyl-ACP methyl ester carboxylesterase